MKKLLQLLFSAYIIGRGINAQIPKGRRPILKIDTIKETREDGEIIRLFLSRTENAIKYMAEKYGRLAYSISYNILHSREDAEECVNDALLGVWNSIPPKNPSSLSAYFCSLVRNISFNRFDYNHAEKRNSDMNVILDELEGVLASNDEYDDGEITRVINEFLAEQNERDRVTFVRRYYFSDSVTDIAAAFGESKGAVAMRLSRTRAKLKKKLEKEGVGI